MKKKNKVTKKKAVRAFMTLVCEQPVIFARDRFDDYNWAIDITGDSPRLKTPKNWDTLPDELDYLFRKNFVSRCKMAQGFSSITLTLLHECGHWMTRSVVDPVEYCKLRDRATKMEMYMDIPYERIATEWAICWLNCPANRKLAKIFERHYFGYGV